MAQSKSEEYLKWLNKPGNREKKNAQKREWNAKNRERIKAYKVEHNTADIKARDYEKHKQWKKKNPERLKVYNKRYVAKINASPEAKVRKKIRQIIYCVLKSKAKNNPSIELLTGCNKVDLKLHLESKFRDGMTWDNYGSYWQVDHIKPLILFDVLNPEQYRLASHYTNLQPLLAVENMKKGKKYSSDKAA